MSTPAAGQVLSELQVLEDLLLAPLERVWRTDPTHEPSYEETVAMHAYLVLGHACLEEFLEEMFRSAAYYFAERANVGPPSNSVAAFAYAVSEFLPDKKRSPYKSRTLTGLLAAGKTEYETQFVDQNNGLKIDYLEKLCRGLGLSWSDFEAAVGSQFPALNTLGGKRGPSAHLSTFSQRNRPGLQQVLEPADVRQWVHDCLEALLVVETYLITLL